MKKLIGLIMIFGLIVSLQSCMQEKGTDNPDNLVAPTLPSTEFLIIPTQEFGFVSDEKKSSTRNDKSNWIHAGVNILVWNTVVFVHTTAPIAAFGHAFNYKAEYIGDSSFEWKYQYDHQEDGVTYDVSLIGQYISDQTEVAWTMYLNVQGNNEKFLWFEGIVPVGNKSGKFVFYKDPNNPKKYMELAYDKEHEFEGISIRFTNILPGDAGNGDYIEWIARNGGDYDREYDVMMNGNLLEMEGNENTKDGRVKDPKHFNDSEWHCWDESRNNIDC